MNITEQDGWAIVPGPKEMEIGFYSTCLSETDEFDNVPFNQVEAYLNNCSEVKCVDMETNPTILTYKIDGQRGLIYFQIVDVIGNDGIWDGCYFWGNFDIKLFEQFWGILLNLSENIKIHSPDCELIFKEDFEKRWLTSD